MANVGDQRGPLFNRRYVAANPDNTKGPLTWNLSDRDVSQGDIGGGGVDKIPVSSGSGLLSADCAVNELLYLITSGPNLGTLAPASASAMSSANVVGAALQAKTAGENVSYTRNSTISITNANVIVDGGGTTLTPGATYYLSTNAGNYTTTAPTTTGQVIVDVGVALSNNQMAIEIQTPIQL